MENRANLNLVKLELEKVGAGGSHENRREQLGVGLHLWADDSGGEEGGEEGGGQTGTSPATPSACRRSSSTHAHGVSGEILCERAITPQMPNVVQRRLAKILGNSMVFSNARPMPIAELLLNIRQLPEMARGQIE